MTPCIRRRISSTSQLEWAAMALLLLALAGCRKPTATVPPSTGSDQAAASKVADASRARPSGEQAASMPHGDGAARSEGESAREAGVEQGPAQAVVTDAETPLTASPPEPQTAAVPAERLLLLSPGGPLVVDLHITISGRPYQESFDQLVSQVLRIADTDGDGTVLWTELTSHPRFRYGQYGNPRTDTYREQQDIIRIYDSIRNDRVDADEVARYLTSNMGSSEAMALQTSNYHREFNRLDSPVRRWLDADKNRVLSDLETTAAAGRLRLRDADEDEILLPADFQDAPLPPTAMASTRPRTYGPDAALHVTDRVQWGDVLYAVQELYARHGELMPEDFPLTPDLFGQLDRNQDASLDIDDLALLASIEPHIAVNVEFDPAVESQDSTRSRISFRSLHLGFQTVRQAIQRSPQRITLLLPDLVLDLYVNDRAAAADTLSQARALLARGDGNKDQYLDSDEFAAVAQQFNVPLEGIDTDGNEKIYVDEIQTFLQQRQAALQNQVRVQADDQPDALFPSLDSNSDGRLDGREIARIGHRLAQMDRDRDGQVALHEIPGSMAVGVARGNPQDQTLFDVPLALPQPNEKAPRWFLSMDRNRDGGISAAEFLGHRDSFATLDTNQDGFVDCHEALAAKAD